MNKDLDNNAFLPGGSFLPAKGGRESVNDNRAISFLTKHGDAGRGFEYNRIKMKNMKH